VTFLVANGQVNRLEKISESIDQGYILKKVPLVPFSPVMKLLFSIPETSNVKIFFTDESEKDTLLVNKYYKLPSGQYTYNWNSENLNLIRLDKIIFIADSDCLYSNDYYISKYYPKEIIREHNQDKNKSPFYAISLDSSHFIATKIKVEPNIPTKIYLTNEDNSINYILFNDTLAEFKNIIITYTEYRDKIKDRYSDSAIITFPQLNSGLYKFVYETACKKYVEEFVYLK
jgi:hypothetical protein